MLKKLLTTIATLIKDPRCPCGGRVSDASWVGAYECCEECGKEF